MAWRGVRRFVFARGRYPTAPREKLTSESPKPSEGLSRRNILGTFAVMPAAIPAVAKATTNPIFEAIEAHKAASGNQDSIGRLQSDLEEQLPEGKRRMSLWDEEEVETDERWLKCNRDLLGTIEAEWNAEPCGGAVLGGLKRLSPAVNTLAGSYVQISSTVTSRSDRLHNKTCLAKFRQKFGEGKDRNYADCLTAQTNKEIDACIDGGEFTNVFQSARMSMVGAWLEANYRAANLAFCASSTCRR